MADNVAITAGAGVTIAADEVVDGTLGTVKVQYVKIMDATLDGTAKAAVGANGLKVDGSGVTQPVSLASVPSHAVTNAGTFAVQVSNANANGGATAANSAPVVNADQYAQYETVAASATTQALGASGATGDYLAGVLVFPGTAGCGVVTILDNATTIGTFAGGGATALPSLVPFMIPVGLFSVSGAWKITTGANVTAVGIGKFT